MSIGTIFYGYPAKIIAEWCGVSIKSADHYKKGTRFPSKPVARLFLLHRDAKILGSDWDGWKVRGEILYSPEGIPWTQNQLRGFNWILELAREKDPKRYIKLIERACAQDK